MAWRGLTSPPQPSASASGSWRPSSRGDYSCGQDAHLAEPPPASSSRPHLPSSPWNQEASGSVGEEITTPAVALRKIAAAAAAAALVAGDGSEGSGEPRKIAEDPKARARRGEPAGPRRARAPGSPPLPPGVLNAPPELGASAAGRARTWAQGGSAEAAGGRRFRAIIPASLSLSPCLLRLLLPPPAPRKQENGPGAEQPPSDHGPVRGADFEGNLSRTAWAQPESCQRPGARTAPRGPAGVYRLCLLGAPGGSGSRFCRKSPALVASGGCRRRC